MRRVNALQSAITFDAQYAPEILIFRFTRWPSKAEQKAALDQLIASKHLGPRTSGLLDITAMENLPDPDGLAAGLAQAQANNSVLRRIACVVKSQAQARFVTTLQMMAPQPNKIAVFFSDADALRWLVETLD